METRSPSNLPAAALTKSGCARATEVALQLTHFNPSTGTPRWSPDGQQIVFDSRPAGNADIFVIDSQGGAPRTLTSEPSNEVVPSWSRDGRWIYFASDRTGRSEVWKMPSTGGSAARVTRHGGFAAFESPDGKFLYYAKGLTGPGIWRIPTNGGEEVELISSPEAGHWGYWAVAKNGIYFLDTATKPGIVFLRLHYPPHYAGVRPGEPPRQETRDWPSRRTTVQSSTHNWMP